ncbi:MAG: hypothetical protein AAF750_04770 [Planctomycetota bacterium]
MMDSPRFRVTPLPSRPSVRLKSCHLVVLLLATLCVFATPLAAARTLQFSASLTTGLDAEGLLLRDDGIRFLYRQTRGGQAETRSANIIELRIEELPPAALAMRPDDAENENAWLTLARWTAVQRYNWLTEFALRMSLIEPGVQSAPLMLNVRRAESLTFEEDDPRFAQLTGFYRGGRLKVPAAFGGNDRERPARRYLLPTTKEVQANLKQAEAWFEAAKQIEPSVHIIETPNFIIYSGWPRSNDPTLKKIYTRLYEQLCDQFNVPIGQHIWAGRLPVYAFWDKQEFVRFCVEQVDVPQDVASKAGGFYLHWGDFDAVILGPVLMPGMRKADARKWFFNLLVHESTHAFLARYYSRERVPSWLNEGMAETLASRMVSQASSDRKLAFARDRARQGWVPDPDRFFDETHIPLEPEYYGAAQAVTRYLIRHDRRQYIELIRAIKDGKTDEEALKETFGWTRKELLMRWARSQR